MHDNLFILYRKVKRLKSFLEIQIRNAKGNTMTLRFRQLIEIVIFC